MTTLPPVIEPVTMPDVDEIRWSIAEPDPATPPITVVGPPTGLTDSRADLVAWWRWRFARLKAENSRMEDLLIRAISDATGYRRATAVRQGREPIPQGRPQSGASQLGLHGHQHEVGLVAREPEAHDREADRAPIDPSHHGRSLGIEEERRYGLWRPSPREASLDHPARQLCDRCRVGRASGLEPDLRSHHESVPLRLLSAEERFPVSCEALPGLEWY